MLPTAELRPLAGLAADDASQDALLTVLRTRATAILSRALSRFLAEPTARVELRSGGCSCSAVGLSSLYLWDDPSAGVSMTVRVRARAGDTWTALLPGDVVVEGRLLALRNGGTFPPGPATVEIAYSVGYALGAGPPELVALFTQVFSAWYYQTAEDPSLAGETLGDYSYSRFTDSSLLGIPGVSAAIDRWRRRIA